MDRIRLTALAAALAAALPAAAAPRTSAPPPATRPSAPAAAPAALSPQRPATPASLAAAPDAPASAWRVGPALGLELGLGDQDYSAVKVRLEAQRELRRVSPVATLSFVGSLGMAHASGSESVPVVVDPFFGIVQSARFEWDANVFELVPAARLTYAAGPRVSVFADGGLGVVYTAARTFAPSAGSLGAVDLVEDGVGGVLRLAGGLVLAPTPALRVHLEVVGLHLRFGDGPGTALDLVASISHRL